jgi:thiamine biosynthesis lipoprotein
MRTLAVARHAMATRFEVLLHGKNEVSLRAAAEEALDEIERLDAQLSLYNPASEISHINAQAARDPVRVEPALFRLLQQAKELSRKTNGAFDITVGPLVRCWGFMRGSGKLPHPADVAEARTKVGIEQVEMDERDYTVRFTREGVMIDLGSIGKGFALECAAQLLRDAGVTSAILHGGTSTVCAIGAPPDAATWNVAVPHPDFAAQSISSGAAPGGNAMESGKILAVVALKDEALSVSAVWGKAFAANGKVYGHVIDPRKGEPVEGAVFAAVVLPSATESDALSTALLIEGGAGLGPMTGIHAGMRTLVVTRGEKTGQFDVDSKGIPLAGALQAGFSEGPSGRQK